MATRNQEAWRVRNEAGIDFRVTCLKANISALAEEFISPGLVTTKVCREHVKRYREGGMIR